jgi:hypothetical protein
MGFMDKAKQLAEQAQHKLDEVQQNFNKGGSTAGQQPGGDRFDEHGRPVKDGPPAGDAPPPSAQPPTQPESSPDPFKPLE